MSSKSNDSAELARQILEVIIRIPKGKVLSYGQVAKMAGLPKHARLVGYVLKNLDESSDVPWFRVLNSQGKISLNKLDEKGQNIQQILLRDEGVWVENLKVDMKKYAWFLNA